MAFNFPNHEREIFQKTFLKDIYISFGFKPMELNGYNASKLTTFFKETFDINELNLEQLSSGIEVRSQDEQLKFTFGLDHVEQKMKFPAYRKFEVALIWAKKMLEYLSTIGITEITALTIGKYNELQYKFSQSDKTVDIAMKNVFSQELLKCDCDKDSFDEEASKFNSLARWEKRIIKNDPTIPDTRFLIEYGFKESENQKGEGVLTMKTLISKNSPIVVEETITVMNQLNKILDNGFRWCVNESIINEMRE